MALSLRFAAPLIAGTLAVSWPATSSATWSVVGVDPQTQEVGIAGASCIGGVEIIAGLAPGYGAVASQSYSNTQARDYAVMRLTEGATPEQIISEIANSQYDFMFEWRQYGIAALGETPAGFTGSSNMAWAGNVSADGVSVQGNILTGPPVIQDALADYQATAGECPYALAEKLMVALEAGAAEGGDTRCTTQQTALSAFLFVARPGDDAADPFVKIIIPEVQKDGTTNPVTLLRAAYDDYKQQNPPAAGECEGGGTSGTTGSGGSTGPGTSGTDSGGESAGSSGATTGGGGSTTAGEGSTGGPVTTTGTDTADLTAGETSGDMDDKGCACRSRSGGPPLAWVVVVPIVFRRRRATG